MSSQQPRSGEQGQSDDLPSDDFYPYGLLPGAPAGLTRAELIDRLELRAFVGADRSSEAGYQDALAHGYWCGLAPR